MSVSMAVRPGFAQEIAQLETDVVTLPVMQSYVTVMVNGQLMNHVL